MVKVCEWDGANWNQMGSNIVGVNADDSAGQALSLSRDGMRVAVGSPGNDDNGVDAGHVRVFEWDGSNWSLMGAAIEGDAGSKMGTSVALSYDGSRLITGEPYFNTNVGRARVWEWDGSTWNPFGHQSEDKVYVKKNAGFYNGKTVAISYDGNRVAVGSMHNAIQAWEIDVWTNDWVPYAQKQYGGHKADRFSHDSLAMNADGTIFAAGGLGMDVNSRDSGGVNVYDLQVNTGRRKMLLSGGDNDDDKEREAYGRAQRRSHNVRASFYQPDPHCAVGHYKNAVGNRLSPSTSCETLPMLGGAWPAPNVENKTFASLSLPCDLLERLPEDGILAMMYLYKVTLNAAASNALPDDLAGPVVSLLPHSFPVAPDFVTVELPYSKDLGSSEIPRVRSMPWEGSTQWESVPVQSTKCDGTACLAIVKVNTFPVFAVALEAPPSPPPPPPPLAAPLFASSTMGVEGS